MYSWGDFHTFLLDNDNRIYSFQVYRKVFTPYEIERKFMDESVFEDGSYIRHGVIVEAVELNNDFLIGIQECDFDEDEHGELIKFHEEIVFYKLSELRLSCRKEG